MQKQLLIGILIGVLLSLTVIVLAGNPDSPGGPIEPSSQLYTLEQIYNRLTTGEEADKMTTFTEPNEGSGQGTMHTLDDIYQASGPKSGVPKTGQTECWNSSGEVVPCEGTGQDGEYQLGRPVILEPTNGATGAYTIYCSTETRFFDNNDGTVTDNLTGLIWLKDASCTELAGTDENGMGPWATALTATLSLASGTCGLSDSSNPADWRLPNINELHSLVDLTQSNPAVPGNHPFTGVKSYMYWSSTTYESYIPYAWGVHLGDGSVYSYWGSKFDDYYIWPVRGG